LVFPKTHQVAILNRFTATANFEKYGCNPQGYWGLMVEPYHHCFDPQDEFFARGAGLIPSPWRPRMGRLILPVLALGSLTLLRREIGYARL